MSAGQFLPEGDDGSGRVPLALPLNNSSFALGASDEEHVDWHCEREACGSDLHVSVNDFEIGDSPHPQRQSGHTLTDSDSLDRASVNTDEVSHRVNRVTANDNGDLPGAA